MAKEKKNCKQICNKTQTDIVNIIMYTNTTINFFVLLGCPILFSLFIYLYTKIYQHPV